MSCLDGNDQSNRLDLHLLLANFFTQSPLRASALPLPLPLLPSPPLSSAKMPFPFPNFNPNSRNHNPQNPFSKIQTHLSAFLHHLTHFPLQNPALSLKTHLQTTLQNLQTQAQNEFNRFAPAPNPNLNTISAQSPRWARVNSIHEASTGPTSMSMSTEAIEERLAGVPVYTLSSSDEEFVLVSGVRSKKSLGLFCFKEEDAEALLAQMKVMDPSMQRGSKVVAVALNKVFQLKVDGVAFRFIPDSHQIMNAIKEKEKAGDCSDGFSGVPVFQCQSLILASQNKRYRPVFFRKEDLEKSLLRASRQQKRLNPSFRKGDIQVCVLEEIIQGMKDGSTSKWDDVVFIPPGFDVSTDPSQQ